MADAAVGALSAALALLLIFAAIHKAIDRVRMIDVLQQFASVPVRWAPAALACTVVAELGAGAALAWPPARSGGAFVAMLLWIGYAALLSRAVVTGRRDVDCGCRFDAGRQPIGYQQVLRALSLAAAAVVIVLSGPARAHVALYSLLDLAAGATFYAVFSACNASFDLRASIRRPQ